MSVTELSTICADESGIGNEAADRVEYCSIEEMQASAESAGDLRESVLHRHAQYCNCVRGRLLIDQ